MTQEVQSGRLSYPGEIRKYILGGNAKFTLVSTRANRRFTFKVKSAAKNRDKNWSTGNQDRTTFFVSVLTDGSDDFAYIGLMKQLVCGAYRFETTKASRFREGAPSFDAFAYCWNSLEYGASWPTHVEFWHEGQCCICGRTLTVPESVAAGIGPECMAKAGM